LSEEVDLAKAFGEGEFVLGDAVRVESAGEWASVVDGGSDATTAELGGTGERRGASADEGNGEAGVGAGGERQRRATGVESVHSEALQAADFDGLLVVAMHDAGAFAKDIYGTGAGAAGTEDVRFKDGFGRTFEVIRGDLLDEFWDVDVRWAGLHAGSVEAVKTAMSFGDGSGFFEGRM
jgi:hypothetical protein